MQPLASSLLILSFAVGWGRVQEVVLRTIGSIADQTEANRIVMVVGWEGRTPDRDARTRQIQDKFAHSFKQLLFTVHELAPDEIASKAANANWALRQAVNQVFTPGNRHFSDNL
jgi:hypothetical protein